MKSRCDGANSVCWPKIDRANRLPWLLVQRQDSSYLQIWPCFKEELEYVSPWCGISPSCLDLLHFVAGNGELPNALPTTGASLVFMAMKIGPLCE